MRHRPALALSTLALAALAAPAAAQAAPFEGIVTQQVTGRDGRTAELTTAYKGPSVRMDVTQGGMAAYVLIDATAGSMVSVIPSQQMYMAMNPAMARRMTGPGPDSLALGKITRTGRTEEVAGHSCEHYLVGDRQDTDVCAAKGLGIMGVGVQQGGARMEAEMRKLAAQHPEWAEFLKDGFFPLKISTADGASIVVTRIERKALDPAMFAVPKEYREMKLPGM